MENHTKCNEWFGNIERKPRHSFISFDIVDFYTSISENLLNQVLSWASSLADISDEDISIINPLENHSFSTTENRGLKITRRLHRRSLRLPTRRKWAQSGYLCTTPSTAQAGADAGISWS